MIMSLDKRMNSNSIDLAGPEGNSFVLLGYAKRMGKEVLELKEDEIKVMLDDMMSGDYEHLIEVFEEYFGDWVVLYK